MLLQKMLGTHKFMLEKNMILGNLNEGKGEGGKYLISLTKIIL